MISCLSCIRLKDMILKAKPGTTATFVSGHTPVLVTVQIEVQVPIKTYRYTLPVTKHETPLPRTRQTSVVDAIPGRDAMDDRTGVPKKDRRTRAAVREKRGDCEQHLRGGVGGDKTNKLQREETSVNSPVITAEKSSRKGATSVLPVTSGTPPPGAPLVSTTPPLCCRSSCCCRATPLFQPSSSPPLP